MTPITTGSSATGSTNTGLDTTAARPGIHLHDVGVTLGRTEALSGATADFEAGHCTALVGPNGAGKTTVLRLLAGLVEPSNGRIERPEKPTVAYVAQHQHQHRWMPLVVAEVLLMSRYRSRGPLGRIRSSDRAAIAEAADRLEINDLLKRPFGELSGGQRQRVLIASAVAADAELLLLDEPITGLDLPSQERIFGVLEEERNAGKVVVMSSHDLDEARRCDRVVLLNRSVLAVGPPEEVLTVALLRQAFAGSVLDGAVDPTVIDDHGHGTHRHDA